MRIVLVTDAWHPQINGVVHTWTYMQKALTSWGHDFVVISPAGSRTIPAPTEPDVRLSIEPRRHILRVLAGKDPDILHIATEGPLGLAARKLAERRGWRYTTSFHTMFPDYLEARAHVPASITWHFMRWFHKHSQRVLVPTPTVRDKLVEHGFKNLHVWARGVDTERFRPEAGTPLPYPRPVHLCVGRVAREKNLDAFLSLDLPGTKVIVGGGPDEARLRRKYPQTVFLGMQPHSELARYYAGADVFVFPSRTDTFGLVMLEAAACGTPVAAYRCEAPLAVVQEGRTGFLDDDLGQACLKALELDREDIRRHALDRSWTAIAHQLLDLFVPADVAREKSDFDWYPQGAQA
jgi:glycosyltransferase involved in cell wall biosynthesis